MRLHYWHGTAVVRAVTDRFDTVLLSLVVIHWHTALRMDGHVLLQRRVTVPGWTRRRRMHCREHRIHAHDDAQEKDERNATLVPTHSRITAGRA